MKTIAFALLLSIAAAAPAAADAITEARAHYVAAEYERALTALAAATAGGEKQIVVEQYRAFCLIALGKNQEAEEALTAIVRLDPTFVLSSEDASPRVLSMFTDVRATLLPDVVKKTLAAGRDAYKENARATAADQFELAVTLLDDPAMKDNAAYDDLRLLASGFLDLARADAEPEAVAEKDSAPAPPLPTPAVMVGPVAIVQTLPEWAPRDAVSASRDFSGAIAVLIGADGRVKDVTMRRPTYPSYDVQLMQAARNWVYKPATRNGQPVESEKVIEIQLRARND